MFNRAAGFGGTCGGVFTCASLLKFTGASFIGVGNDTAVPVHSSMTQSLLVRHPFLSWTPMALDFDDQHYGHQHHSHDWVVVQRSVQAALQCFRWYGWE